MYAAVEFEDRDCMVVPLSWLCENQTKCFWPKTSTEEQFYSYVKSCKDPKQWWQKYAVRKILYVSDDYEKADRHLIKAIEESCSSDVEAEKLSLKNIGHDTQNENLDIFSQTLCNYDESSNKNYELDSDFTSDEDADKAKSSSSSTPTFGKRKKTTPLSRKLLLSKKKKGEDSSSEFSEEESEKSQRLTTSMSSSPNVVLTSTGNETSRKPVLTEATSTPSCNVVPQNEVILERLAQILLCQEQDSLILDNILKAQQTLNMQTISRPSNVPTFPVSTKTEYKALEMFLENEGNFDYMKARLKLMSGSNVRKAVMNMLTFLITNKVAMKFSYAGREKRAFKDTRMMNCIREAIQEHFAKSELPFSDGDIVSATQDWLKLAKSRYNYHQEKNK